MTIKQRKHIHAHRRNADFFESNAFVELSLLYMRNYFHLEGEALNQSSWSVFSNNTTTCGTFPAVQLFFSYIPARKQSDAPKQTAETNQRECPQHFAVEEYIPQRATTQLFTELNL